MDRSATRLGETSYNGQADTAAIWLRALDLSDEDIIREATSIVFDDDLDPGARRLDRDGDHCWELNAIPLASVDHEIEEQAMEHRRSADHEHL